MEVPNDAMYNILLNLNFREIMGLCPTDKNIYYICNSIDFWVYKINYDFNVNFSRSELLNFNYKKWLLEYYNIFMDINPTITNKSFYKKIINIYDIFIIIANLVDKNMKDIATYDTMYINLIDNKEIVEYLPNDIKSNINVNIDNNVLQIDYDDDYVIYYPIDNNVYNMQLYDSNYNEIYLMLFRFLVYNPEGNQLFK